MPSSGMEAVRAMQTTLRLKLPAGAPASTRNRLFGEKKGMCANPTCTEHHRAIKVTDLRA